MDFDTLIVITDKDFERVSSQYERLLKNMPGRRVLFVGPPRVEELVIALGAGGRAGYINENDILPFDEVHALMSSHMKERLGDQEMPRGVTGWYYQQFLKLSYAFCCPDSYYMTWDGDTIPCAPFSMFDDQGRPFMDMKREYHREYFETMEKLIPGLSRTTDRSFISEHLLFDRELVRELVRVIEGNDSLEGRSYWEKIIRAIPPELITKSAFSEFETYGSFVTTRYPDRYVFRSWHSFRTGGDFFDIGTICDRDYEWLAVDFAAISFEKWSSVREDHRNLFDNPEYQKKLSARQMLQIAQEEFTDGYIEVWD